MRGFLKPIRIRGPFEQGGRWTPLRLNPHFAMLPGIGTFSALTAAPAVAGDGDAVQTVNANTSQQLTAASAAVRPVWRAGAGRPYLDFSSAKRLVQTANIGITGDAAFTVIVGINANTSGIEASLLSFGPNAEGRDFRLAVRAANQYAVIFTGLNSNFTITTPAPDGWDVVTVRKSPGVISSTTEIRVNGVTGTWEGSGASITPNIGNGPLCLNGIPAGASLGDPLIGPVLIWNHNSLSLAEIAKAEGWVRSRIPA